MAGRTLITFAQEGQDPITFEVSAHMMDKVYQKIARVNEAVVLGQQMLVMGLERPPCVPRSAIAPRRPSSRGRWVPP